MAANGFKRRFHGDDSGQRDTGQLLFTAEVWKRIGFALDIAPRELDVVRQVFNARSEAAIARELGLSPHTVHTYLGRVYRKLNVTNRVQLVVRVVAQHQVLASVPPEFDRRKQTIRGRSLGVSPV